MPDSGSPPEARRYRIRGVIGRGGFGTVYLADLLGQSGFTRSVALKVLNPDVKDLPSIAERLRDEARLLGMLRHRSIVRVDGLVRLDGRWTIVMEYVEGVSVAVLAEQGRMPLGVSIEIAGEIAGALHVANSTPGPTGEPLNLLHRDIKPANVLVSLNGEVKVLDFGVARANFEAREAKTQNMMFGSIGYMAPERYDLREEHASDVYAVGVLLWELLLGDTYGRASTKPELYDAHKVEAMAKVPTDGSIPPGVVTLLDNMLSYEPKDRPSARDVERTLRDLRLEAPSPWLRDWAEDCVPALVGTIDPTQGHDFSSDILSEARSLGLPPPSPEPPPPPADGPQALSVSELPAEDPETRGPKRSLPTFTDDLLSEDPPLIDQPATVKSPLAATPDVDSWSSELSAIASKRKRPPWSQRSPARRSLPPRTGPSGTRVILQAFGGVSLVALIAIGICVLGMFVMCCACSALLN
ncbi:MAG: serine/threonine protein kinase [Myxococcota bacterium]|jgi:serine/threonine protein kinase